VVTRGQIWSYVQGSRRYRVLIISSDEHNEQPGILPWALRIDRDVAPVDSQLLVRLGDDDPFTGTVAIPAVVRIDPSALRDDLGFAAESTMIAVERGLREFLELP
jgi:mRNA-degrading endonuclease toxin of MazEF toxin-antitoxin module